MGVICTPFIALTRKDQLTGQPVTFELSTKFYSKKMLKFS